MLIWEHTKTKEAVSELSLRRFFDSMVLYRFWRCDLFFARNIPGFFYLPTLWWVLLRESDFSDFFSCCFTQLFLDFGWLSFLGCAPGQGARFLWPLFLCRGA